jgi:sugar lactone lactonase YvrE
MFGGPELKQLYITSAWDRLSEEQLEKQPLAGHVFVLETEVPGQSPNLFGR